MIGYKVFDPDWRCMGFQYKVGRTYRFRGKIELCRRGFHFCKKLAQCFSYYDFNPNNKVAIVKAFGKIQENYDGSKCCTSKITIVRELSWSEVLEMVNQGKGNTGINNTGDFNSGDLNSGDHNSGNRNSGDHNSGSWNTGDHNSGKFNSGGRNFGDYNAGNGNSGHRNSGNDNCGNGNSGDGNFGDYNSGRYNSGDRNIGSYNSGDYNCGYFNTGDYGYGAFNTDQSRMYLFDKVCDWTLKDFLDSTAYRLLTGMPTGYTVWVCASDMTYKETAANPSYRTTGGCLRRVKVSEMERQAWWEALPDWRKVFILLLPNFDAEKFYQCTGIRVSEEDLKLVSE